MKLDDFGLVADENIHPEVIEFLRRQGFDVQTTSELALLGKADDAVMRAAHSENRMILTHDGDFGRLAIAAREPFVGLVLLRPGHIDPLFTIRAVECLIAADLDVTSPFIIVVRRHGHRVRIRLRRAP